MEIVFPPFHVCIASVLKSHSTDFTNPHTVLICALHLSFYTQFKMSVYFPLCYVCSTEVLNHIPTHCFPRLVTYERSISE
jgi:hypothetical protein